MIRDSLHTLGLTLQLSFCSVAFAAGTNDSFTYGGFRPLDQPDYQMQGYSGGAFGMFGSGQAGQTTDNYRQQPQMDPYRQSPQYRFREMPGQTAPANPGPRFRPDPRFDQENQARGGVPRRWTGNDVIAPHSGRFETDGRAQQQPQPYYPYAPQPGPQQHLDPNAPAFGFPVPGYMPFGW